MRHKLTFGIVLIAAIALSVSALIARRSPSGGQRSHAVELAQPQDWVPFTADVRVFHPGVEAVAGKFYRSANGSTRMETGPLVSAQPLVISIHNVGLGLTFIGRKGKWESHPIVLGPEGHRPPRLLDGAPGRHKLDYKIRGNENGTTERLDPGDPTGFEAYQYNAGSGAVAYEVPALNFFRVIQQNAVNGRREVYFNIKIAEPPEALFTPPTGAVVAAQADPKGLVYQSLRPRGPAR